MKRRKTLWACWPTPVWERQETTHFVIIKQTDYRVLTRTSSHADGRVSKEKSMLSACTLWFGWPTPLLERQMIESISFCRCPQSYASLSLKILHSSFLFLLLLRLLLHRFQHFLSLLLFKLFRRAFRQKRGATRWRKNVHLEKKGIDPFTSRMRSARSTIWATSPWLKKKLLLLK